MMYQGLEMVQVHENDRARAVLVHEPEFAQTLGSIHPALFLYREPFSLDIARVQHRAMVEFLRKSGIEVWTRLALEELALTCLVYHTRDNLKSGDLTEEERLYVSSDYKRSSLARMTVGELVDIIMTRPTLSIEKPEREGPLRVTSVELKPLTNLTFCRDQQIVTMRGVIMGQPFSTTRSVEIQIMKFVWQKLGIKVAGEVPLPGHLEGGDFLAAGSDLCFIGLGLRTNKAAIDYLLKNDLMGTRRVAMVEDRFERHGDRMHLDTVFNIVDTRVGVIAEDIVGDEAPHRRIVTEFCRDEAGRYLVSRPEVEFGAYLRQNGFHLVSMPVRCQLAFGCNTLNLGGGLNLFTNEEAARVLLADRSFRGEATVLPLDGITCMNGGIHCSTQVFRVSSSP